MGAAFVILLFDGSPASSSSSGGLEVITKLLDITICLG